MINHFSTDSPNTIKKRKVSLIQLAILFFVLYAQWGFIFYVTIFENTAIANAIYSFIGFLFIVCFLFEEKNTIKDINVSWIIYSFITIVSMAVNIKIINLIPWICYLVIILKAARTSLEKLVPMRIIFWSGVIAMVGVFLQFFLPTFYYGYVNNLFLEKFLQDGVDVYSDISDIYGMRGFFYGRIRRR